jgi:tRNA threonylcarbamoyladenosine biosynthesis protein TsaB
MRYAAFETSTEWCSVALWLDGESAGLEEPAGNRHSMRLLPMLERVAAAAGISLASLDGVAFGAGPGSFTGLRIACGAAQGIAYARDLPVLGISTLEALAEESRARRVLACLDARMHEVYYSAFERTDGKPDGRWRAVIPATCAAPGAVRVPAGDGWIGCGSGFAMYGAMGLGSVIPGLHPSAMAVARLAAPRFALGEGVDAALALPDYVRDRVALTEAEREAAQDAEQGTERAGGMGAR